MKQYTGQIGEKTHKKLTWIAIALSFSFPIVVVMLLTFIIAYINPSKAVIVYINEYGEATIELILFSIIALANFVALACLWIMLYKTRK